MKLRSKLIGTKFKHIPSSINCAVLLLLNHLINNLNVAMNSLCLTRLRIRQPCKNKSVVGTAILVILIAVNNGYHASGTTLGNGPIPEPWEVDFSKYLSGTNDTSFSSKFSHRTPKQMNFIATTIRTMGCIPKFFCGMKIKSPSRVSSTMNDLFYLLKFAMSDAYDEVTQERQDKPRFAFGYDDDSGEDIDPEFRTDSEERRDHKRLEKKAEDLLAETDPGFIKFMRGSSTKSRSRMDEVMAKEALESALEKEEKQSKSKIGALFSGVKNMFRLGKSWKHPTTFNKTKPFWQSKEFRQQMLLASKIAESERSGEQPEEDNNICSSTFDLCPYTYNQMMHMIKGEPVKNSEPSESTTTQASVLLSGVSVPMSHLSPGQPQLSQSKPTIQPDKQIAGMFPPNWAVNRVEVPSTSVVGLGKGQPQPIIYVVHPEGMKGLNFNSNSTPTPTPTKKTYTIKSKTKPTKTSVVSVQINEQEGDDDEYTQNWPDPYIKDKNKGPNAFSIIQNNFSNKTRPFQEENYHKFSKIKPTPTQKASQTKKPQEPESESGSDEDDQITDTKKFNRQKHRDPQNSEASQSEEEDKPSNHDDHRGTSSSEEGDDDEIEGPNPLVNGTIYKPNKSQISKKRPPLQNNKDTSASDEDEDGPPENDNKTSEEDVNESEEEKIVWAAKMTFSTTTTPTTPTPKRRTTQKYKLHPQRRNRNKPKNSSENNSEREKFKNKNKPQNRRPSSNTPHQKDLNKKLHFSEGIKHKSKLLSKRPPKTSTTSTAPPIKLPEKNQDSEEALEESYEEEPDLKSPPPTEPPPPTQPPRPLTTTRKPRPARPRPTPANSYSSITTPYTEPEYGFLPQLPSVVSDIEEVPALSGLPVPSPIMTTTAAPSPGSMWNTNYTNFSYHSFQTVTTSTPPLTVPPMNLFSAMSQASKVKKGFGQFGHLINNILNSSSIAHAIQTDLSPSNYGEEEELGPNFDNFDRETEDYGHRRPQFWNNRQTQRQHSKKNSQNFRPSFNQNVQHRYPAKRPMRQHARPHSQRFPQGQHLQTDENLKHLTDDPYQLQQDMNNYPNYKFSQPEQQQWPFYPTESWSTSHDKKPFEYDPPVPSRVRYVPVLRPSSSSREQFISSSRPRNRVPPTSIQNPRRPNNSEIRPSQNLRRRPTFSSGERHNPRFPKFPQRQRISAEEQNAAYNEENSSRFQATEQEFQAKQMLLDTQQKLQLEFAARLHDLAEQQLKLAQQQVLRKPSSKESYTS